MYTCVRMIRNLLKMQNLFIDLCPQIQDQDQDLPMLNDQEMALLLGDQVEEPALRAEDLLPTSTPFTARDDISGAHKRRLQQTALERLVKMLLMYFAFSNKLRKSNNKLVLYSLKILVRRKY